MRNQIPYFALVLYLFSCGNKTQSDDVPKTFAIEITDSVQVDYLGEMKLLDYDSEREKYLLATDEQREYIEVNDRGEILNHHQFNRDGIDVVGQAVSLGYFSGDVTVFDVQKGYLRFQNSTKIGEITLPYSYDVFLMNPNLGLFESGNRVYYPKPVPHSLMENPGTMFQTMYKLPVIESQDKISGDTLAAVSLPETSAIFDGQVHGFLMPVYCIDDEQLILSIGIEPKLYVYAKEGDRFSFEKIVEIDIPDWAGYTPVPMDKPEKFFEEIRKIRPANLGNIFALEDYYLVTYHKGISEEEFSQLDPATRYGVEAFRKDPNYAVILDKDFNQLATDVPFPAASHPLKVIKENGEMVVSKIAGLSETEDDGIVLYKLKLIEK